MFSLSTVSRPGKSPDRGGRVLDNYEPISPPHSYQGLDKQDPGGPASQRREAESEIRYELHTMSRSYCLYSGALYSPEMMVYVFIIFKELFVSI